MESVSPPVSPNVVAATLMTQKASVTSGTLLAWISEDLFNPQPPIVRDQPQWTWNVHGSPSKNQRENGPKNARAETEDNSRHGA
jgi:hypothetical protein